MATSGYIRAMRRERSEFEKTDRLFFWSLVFLGISFTLLLISALGRVAELFWR
jgi:hypothetical protein